MDTESAHRPRRLVDRRVAAVAGRQHGLVTLEQLRSFGLSEDAVRKRVERGRLQRLFAGAYSVGHRPLTREARFLAAVLACGEGAVLSHRSAAVLHGLRQPQKGERIHVTAPNRRGRSPAGIVAHRYGSLVPADRGTRRGIPCTTVPRTILDLAATARMEELREVIGEAEGKRKLDRGRLRALIRTHRGRRGVARLRLALDEVHPLSKETRSELERRFLRLCRRAGLPDPAVNTKVEVEEGKILEIDFLWAARRFAVEADSRRHHDTDTAFRKDRERDQLLQMAGWRVVRVTWEQVADEPRALGGRLAGLLPARDGDRW